MPNDKTRKKINYTKESKTKIVIKRIELKIEIKNKLEGNKECSIEKKNNINKRKGKSKK